MASTERLQAAFDLLITDGRGSTPRLLGREELKAVLMRGGGGVSLDTVEAEKLIEMFDPENHGQIDLQEFVVAMQLTSPEAVRAFENAKALYHAVEHGDLDVARRLLDESDDIVDALSPNTALWKAAACGHVAVARLLLLRGAQVDLCRPRGYTPLYMATQDNRVEIASLLLDNGAHPDLVTGENGAWPLYIACNFGHVELATLLLDRRADVHRRMAASAEHQHGGETVLSIASQRGHTEVVRLLLQRGATVDVPMASGKTALFCAVLLNQSTTALLLLEAGADADRQDARGRTSRSVALGTGQTAVWQAMRTPRHGQKDSVWVAHTPSAWDGPEKPLALGYTLHRDQHGNWARDAVGTPCPTPSELTEVSAATAPRAARARTAVNSRSLAHPWVV